MVHSLSELRSMLSYCPNTGLFIWVSGRLKGRKAGTPSKKYGYNIIIYKRKTYLGHRLAWLFMTGKWPASALDHKNCDGSDNRWLNLREATASQNRTNSVISKNNLLGVKGVRKTTYNKFRASIQKDGKKYRLGTFTTIEEASAAYAEAAKRLHGEFARIG